jgi:hypothetical protein
LSRFFLGGGKTEGDVAQLSSRRRNFMFFIIKRPKVSTIHTVLTLVWAVLALPTLFWWRESVMWVALMSLWANIASHWAAREAAKANESQQEASPE